MEIAGVRFEIECCGSFSLEPEDATYHDFLNSPDPAGQPERMRVRLHLEDPPGLEGFKKLFDTAESWSLYGRGDERRIVFMPLHYQSPLWVVRFSYPLAGVDLWCNPRFAHRVDGKISVDHPLCYPLDQLLLMYHLASRRGLLLHAAGLSRNGRGAAFPGASGAGKSTLAQLFARRRPGELLSDERLVVRAQAGGFTLFGTPWSGTAGIGANRRARLAGLYFLKHDMQNRVRPLAAEDALSCLLPLCSIPWFEPEVLPHVILLAKEMLAMVPAFELGFLPDESIVDFFAEIFPV